MTEAEAIAYAATWGSYMRAGDPGACMYGFSPETGLKMQSEQHRKDCLDHIAKCEKMVLADPENEAYDEDELDRLAELTDMIENAPLIEN